MKGFKKDSFIPPHLRDSQILGYVDGELSQLEMDVARVHIESCWTCRSRMGEIQDSIHGFLQGRTALLPRESSFGENRVLQFSARLAQHACEVEAAPTPLGERFVQYWNGLVAHFSGWIEYRRAIIASLVSICLLIVMFSDVLNTRVSADTVLLHAEKYEASHLPQNGQVAKTSIQVDRFDRNHNVSRRLGTVTLVKDAMATATYVAFDSPSGPVEPKVVKSADQVSAPLLGAIMSDGNQDPALLSYLKSEQWVPDLSVSEFRRLVNSRGSSEVQAKRAGTMFELHYPFAQGHPSGIFETLLRVNAEDYSPASLSIFTGANGENEYRFTRVSFLVEARTTEVASLFAPIEVAGISTGTARALPGMSRLVPLSYRDSHATEEEVAVAVALHKLDTCLGEEVYVYPMSDGSVLVQGLVDNAARRDAIRQVLRSMGGPLRAEIYTPREIKSGTELYKPPDEFSLASHASSTGGNDTLADLSGSSVPLHDMLYQHFFRPGTSAEDTNKQAALFSDEMVTLARQAFLHAWALKRLDREFSDPRTADLPTGALQDVDKMREDHLRWISTITKHEAEMLTPLLGPEVLSGMEQISGERDSTLLLRLAQEQNELVRSLFTSSELRAPTGPTLSRLVVVLHHMGS